MSVGAFRCGPERRPQELSPAFRGFALPGDKGRGDELCHPPSYNASPGIRYCPAGGTLLPENAANDAAKAAAAAPFLRLA